MTRSVSFGLCAAVVMGVAFVPTVRAQTAAPWQKTEDFGGATPTNKNAWFKVTDYPGSALRDNLQGNVIIAFDISTTGRAENCVVQSSSGHDALDQVPCRLIEERAKFRPALDAEGRPFRTQGRYSIAFWIPD